jgi:hypothetical protein
LTRLHSHFGKGIALHTHSRIDVLVDLKWKGRDRTGHGEVTDGNKDNPLPEQQKKRPGITVLIG